ncbi:MAG: TRAP transporter large permease subunit [Rhodospirillaceae bacterium]|nr:TRAP transporter large permease subunit [Rhodospirillaceae bacterium]
MEWYFALGMLLGMLILFMATGLPVAFSFFAVNLVGAVVFLGGEAGLMQLVRNAVWSVTTFSLAPIPLFILMGEIMFHTGMAFRAIDAVDRLIARVPGRLSLVAVTGGTIFSTLSGSTMANVAMLGSSLLPEMQRRGYHPSMAMGPILGTGGIAMLIPPSALAVLLASLAQMPVAELLIAGIVPGLLIALLFFAYIVVRCRLNPGLAPPYEPEELAPGDRLKPFLIYVVPLMTLFVLVVGSILAGWATPTESAALGAVGAVIAAVAYRCLTRRALRTALIEAAKVTGMALFIICASVTFAQILAFSGAVDGLLEVTIELDFSPITLLVLMLLILLALGAFIDQLSMMLITLPFFMPLAQHAGFDLVWYGVLLLVVLEVSLTTPPFGLLLFVMKGVAPPQITLRQIYVAAGPFIALELLVLILVVVYPALATWLPNLIIRP